MYMSDFMAWCHSMNDASRVIFLKDRMPNFYFATSTWRIFCNFLNGNNFQQKMYILGFSQETLMHPNLLYWGRSGCKI